MKTPIEDNPEVVLEMIKDSITDYDVGWAWIESPTITIVQKDKIVESFMVIKVTSYNSSNKKFKVVVTEIA